MKINKCRICLSKNSFEEIINFSEVALAGSFLKKKEIKSEKKYKLNFVVCKKCKHPQIGFYLNKDLLFKNYLWETGVSNHNINLINRLIVKLPKIKEINNNTNIIEIASNDGSLLKILNDKFHCKVLGVDPALNLHKTSKEKNIDFISDYFSYLISKKIKFKYSKFDICIARNVIAHLKDPNDIFKGVKNLLRKDGLFIIEVPHLLNIFTDLQFDNVFHEHVGFHSLKSIEDLCINNNMYLYDAEKVDSQGGSIRCYISNNNKNKSSNLIRYLKEEKKYKLFNLKSWKTFAFKVEENNNNLRNLLTKLKQKNKIISVYGASGKGQTLLQYLGLNHTFFSYIYDKSTIKQNLYSPGTHIRIVNPKNILQDMPDYILLCSWNLLKEIKKEQINYFKRGGKFIVPFPRPKIIK